MMNEQILGIPTECFPIELLKILESESVYYALRYAVKNPEKTGMDECEDSLYLDLYDIAQAAEQASERLNNE